MSSASGMVVGCVGVVFWGLFDSENAIEWDFVDPANVVRGDGCADGVWWW